MVKVIDYGNNLKRPKMYFKVACSHCAAMLVFEYGDIWWDDCLAGIGRVECPVCRTKTHFDDTLVPSPFIGKMNAATKEEYDKAYQDTSSRTLKMLELEKEKTEAETKEKEIQVGATNNDLPAFV